jgi:hypothetical protein
MKIKKVVILAAFIIAISINLFAQNKKSQAIAERNVRAGMTFLAGDAMQGRGSGTIFERITAEYIGSQFMQFGLEPAGEKDGRGNQSFVQTVDVTGRSFLQDFKISGEIGRSIVYGKDLAVSSISRKEIVGELQKLKRGETAKSGGNCVIDFRRRSKIR